jgi:TrmH family RNA methyltransferase
LPDSIQLDRLSVVLVATRNPLNIGAAARAMSNFGFLKLRVVNPYDVAFREARSAVGAEELLSSAQEYANVSEAVADCSLVVGTTAIGHRELQHPLYPVEQAAPLIRLHLESGPVALLFGSEKRGLSNEDLSHCNILMHIPTRKEHYSMNLGQAVAICLYELMREGRPAVSSAEKRELASAGDFERMTAVLLETLHASGYVHRHLESSIEESIRRLVRRLDISAEDAKTWLGILRQIAWKLRSRSNLHESASHESASIEK